VAVTCNTVFSAHSGVPPRPSASTIDFPASSQTAVQRYAPPDGVIHSRLNSTIRSVDDDDEDDEGRIDFSVALSPKTTRTRNNKPKQ